MKRIIRLVVAALVLIAVPVLVAVAQLGAQEVSFAERNMGGPRLGMTYVFGKELTKRLDEKKIGHFISQFGWHFEYQVIPDGGGPAFVIQFVPLVGAVEYATVVPSATLAMGIRFPGGLEFGIGPNLLATQEYISSSLVLAIGKSINYGGVSIPLNIAAAVNPAGTRFSFVFGYAIAKAPAR